MKLKQQQQSRVVSDERQNRSFPISHTLNLGLVLPLASEYFLVTGMPSVVLQELVSTS